MDVTLESLAATICKAQYADVFQSDTRHNAHGRIVMYDSEYGLRWLWAVATNDNSPFP